MTEDVRLTPEQILGTADATPPAEEPKLNEIEQQAYKEGWRPEAEFEGDPVKWVDAGEFLRRKPLFARIDSLKTEGYQTRQELAEVKKALNALTEHHSKVREVEFQRAIKALQEARQEALEDHDFKTMTDLEDKIDEVREQKRDFEEQLKQQRQQKLTPPPEYVEWLKANPWYETDQEMNADADAFGQAFLKRNPKATPTQVLEHVSEKIHKAYADKFKTPQPKASPVDSGREGAPPVKAKDSIQLTPTEEEMCRMFVKQGIMTRAQYIEQLKSYKG